MNSREMSGSAGETKCLNCAEKLLGRYCRSCSQKAGPAPLLVHDFTHELIHEFLHFDSKILLTLRTLFFSPGMLTREYVEGRRVRYVGPVRLYLVASIVLFGILSFVPIHHTAPGRASEGEDTAQQRHDVPALPPAGGVVQRALELGAQKATHDPEHFAAALRQALSKTVFLR